MRQFFGLYTVGGSESITCTIVNATRVEWLKDGTVVESGTGSQLTLQLSINDSIHHNLYTCRGYSMLRPTTDLNVTTIVNSMCNVCIFICMISNEPLYAPPSYIPCLFSLCSPKCCNHYLHQRSLSSHFGSGCQDSLRNL